VVVNEVIQWTLLVMLAVLMLGVLRQLSLLMPSTARGAESGPPMGRHAPRRLLHELEHAVGTDGRDNGTVVAFLAESCVGCQRLLADLAAGRQTPNGRPLVIVARNPTEGFRAAVDETRLPLIVDSGTLWRECRVTSTPLMVRIDERGRTAMKEVTHRVDAVA
jgi:hypothetical protein